MVIQTEKADPIAEVLEDYGCNIADIPKVVAAIREVIDREEEYKRRGALQAHQEYELAKGR